MSQKKIKQKSENTFNEEENFYGASENEAPETEDTLDRVELPHTVTFDEPIQVGKKTYESISFVRKPTVGSMRHLPGNTELIKLGHYIPIISAMTDLPTAIIEGLDAEYMSVLAGIVAPFLVRSETV